MAPLANWKGFLRLSLVTCGRPVSGDVGERKGVPGDQQEHRPPHQVKYAKVDAKGSLQP
jgi:DNA end-binding protein Ku